MKFASQYTSLDEKFKDYAFGLKKWLDQVLLVRGVISCTWNKITMVCLVWILLKDVTITEIGKSLAAEFNTNSNITITVI